MVGPITAPRDCFEGTHVHKICRNTAGEDVDHRSRRSARHFGDGGRAQTSVVRAQHDVVKCQQRRADRGLGIEHVQRRPGDASGPQRIDECSLVDDAATRRIDQERIMTHQRQSPRVD